MIKIDIDFNLNVLLKLFFSLSKKIIFLLPILANNNQVLKIYCENIAIVFPSFFPSFFLLHIRTAFPSFFLFFFPLFFSSTHVPLFFSFFPSFLFFSLSLPLNSRMLHRALLLPFFFIYFLFIFFFLS